MSLRWESGGAGLSEVEFDLLADYTAGVLSASQADEVERLVATEPRWTRAHTELVAADETVRRELHAVGHEQLAMPADVVARITAALDTATRVEQSGATVVSLDAARARKRGRAARIIGVAAVLIGIVGGAGYVISQVTPTGGGAATSAVAPDADQERSAGGLPQAAAPTPAPGQGPTVFVSDTNYTAATLEEPLNLADAAAAAPPAATNLGGKESAPTVPKAMRDAIRPPLDRLAEPAALAVCLAAIGQTHPGTPTVVEFARFDGQPAVIVVLRLGRTSTVVAVGPACGLAGADEKASQTS